MIIFDLTFPSQRLVTQVLYVLQRKGYPMATIIQRKNRKNRYQLSYVDVDGTQYRIDTGTTDKKIATLWLTKTEELLSQAKLGFIPAIGRIDTDIISGRKQQNEGVSLEEFRAQYEDRCRHDIELSEKTIVENNLAINSFKNVVGNKKLAQITDEDVIKWKRSIIARGRSKTTSAIYHRHLRAAFNRAIKYGIITRNPFGMVEIAKPDPKAEEKDMSPEEVQKFLQVIDNSGDHPFGIFIRFLMYTACRRNQILYLRWEDICLEQKILNVQIQKSQRKKDSEKMTIPINRALCRVLSKMDVKSNGYVFQSQSNSRNAKNKKQPWHPDSVSHWFKNYARKANLPEHYSLHSLRHTYATFLRTKGVPIDIVQKLLGHTSPMTTSKSYDHSIAIHFRAQADLVDFEGEMDPLNMQAQL